MSISRRVIAVRELKAHASEVLRTVEDTGAEFVITVRGRPVARLDPLGIAGDEQPIDGTGGLRGALSDSSRMEWRDFVNAKKLWEPPAPDDE